MKEGGTKESVQKKSVPRERNILTRHKYKLYSGSRIYQVLITGRSAPQTEAP